MDRPVAPGNVVRAGRDATVVRRRADGGGPVHPGLWRVLLGRVRRTCGPRPTEERYGSPSSGRRCRASNGASGRSPPPTHGSVTGSPVSGSRTSIDSTSTHRRTPATFRPPPRGRKRTNAAGARSDRPGPELASRTAVRWRGSRHDTGPPEDPVSRSVTSERTERSPHHHVALRALVTAFGPRGPTGATRRSRSRDGGLGGRVPDRVSTPRRASPRRAVFGGRSACARVLAHAKPLSPFDRLI